MNIVLKVNKEVQDKMIEYYTPKKCDKQIPYVLLQADDNDTVITMYESGKVMFQGISADIDANMWKDLESHFNNRNIDQELKEKDDKINDKTYAEVIKAEEIVNCPHCGRILYKEDEEQEA